MHACCPNGPHVSGQRGIEYVLLQLCRFSQGVKSGALFVKRGKVRSE